MAPQTSDVPKTSSTRGRGRPRKIESAPQPAPPPGSHHSGGGPPLLARSEDLTETDNHRMTPMTLAQANEWVDAYVRSHVDWIDALCSRLTLRRSRYVGTASLIVGLPTFLCLSGTVMFAQAWGVPLTQAWGLGGLILIIGLGFLPVVGGFLRESRDQYPIETLARYFREAPGMTGAIREAIAMVLVDLSKKEKVAGQALVKRLALPAESARELRAREALTHRTLSACGACKDPRTESTRSSWP